MTIQEFITQIANDGDYVNHSLVLKSYDDYGCVYKWLQKCNNLAIRKEIFIELDIEEVELELLNKTVIASIEVNPAK